MSLFTEFLIKAFGLFNTVGCISHIGITATFKDLRRQAPQLLAHSIKQLGCNTLFFCLFLIRHRLPQLSVFFFMFILIDYFIPVHKPADAYKPGNTVKSRSEELVQCPDDYAILIRPNRYVRCEDYDEYQRTRSDKLLMESFK